MGTSDCVETRDNGQMAQMDQFGLGMVEAAARGGDGATPTDLTNLALGGRWLNSDVRAAIRDSAQSSSRPDQRTRKWVRAWDCVELRGTGLSQQETADRLGWAQRQRVERLERAIEHATGIRIGASFRSVREEARVAGEREQFLRLARLLRATPGIGRDELAAAADVPASSVAAILGPALNRFVATPTTHVSPQRWSTEEAIRALQDASRRRPSAAPLTEKQYRRLRAIGEVVGPSTPTIVNRLGPWSAAMRAAGLEANPSVKPVGRGRYHAEDAERYLADFFLNSEPGHPTGLEGYGRWRADKPEYPGASYLRRMVSEVQWSSTTNAMLVSLRSERYADRFERTFDAFVEVRLAQLREEAAGRLAQGHVDR